MKTKRLSIEFPAEDHKYLKMCCTKMGVSMREFITGSILKSVSVCEDRFLSESQETVDFLNQCGRGEVEMVSFDDAMKELSDV